MKPPSLPLVCWPLLLFFALTLALLWAFAPPQSLQSATEAILDRPLLLHPRSQSFAAVDDGRIVWQDDRFGPAEIYLLEPDQAEPRNLTNSGAWEAEPALAGDWVVWRAGYQKIGIHGINLKTMEQFTVTTGHDDTSRPRLAGDIVVWADTRADNWNIYGFDLKHHREFPIATGPQNEVEPQIDGDWVVWRDDEGTIYYDHLKNPAPPLPVVGGGGWQPDLSARDHLIIWQDFRSGDWDIYGYDFRTQTLQTLVVARGDQEQVAMGEGWFVYQSKLPGMATEIEIYSLAERRSVPLTLNSSAERDLAADGDLAVWTDGRNHQWDLYAFQLGETLPETLPLRLAPPTYFRAGALPGGQIVLSWKDSNELEAGYQIERVRGITGTEWVHLVDVPPNTTLFTDTPGVLGESFWYRVRAIGLGGHSAYSREEFNSTIGQSPNPLEEYLMVLINEARADPAAVGYPTYTPVPPLSYHPQIGYSAHSHSLSILNALYQFGHCDPADRCSLARAEAAGYDGEVCVDNLIRGGEGITDIEGAHQGFLDSPGHREAILNPGFNEFAVGYVYDPTKGDWTHGQVTEVFCFRPNVAAPTIPGGVVVPHVGPETTTFTYAVNFYSSSGRHPQAAAVVIDGTPQPLTLSTGQPAHGTYRYTTTLAVGADHTYQFRFTLADGTVAQWPTGEAINYPDVYEADTPFTPTPTATPLIPTITPVATATDTPSPTPTATQTPPGGAGNEKQPVYLPLIRGRP
jgi:beta propeller repeat protein